MFYVIRHVLTHHNRKCVACRITKDEWYKTIERHWPYYIVIAWLMFEYAIVRG